MRHIRHVGRGLVRAAVALAACGGLPLVGCDSSDSTGSSGTGSLAVTISAPAGVTPSVTVSGPSGYQQTFSATKTLTGLAPGGYTVTAGPVPVPHPIVASIYDATVTGGTVTFLANGTEETASVSYARRPGTGALWVGSVGSSNSTLVAYSASQLAASTSAAPAFIVQTGTAAPVAAAFDPNGELWAATNYDNQVANVGKVIGFAVGGLEANVPQPTNPEDALTVTSGSREFLGGMTFDGSGGRLWVSNRSAGQIVQLVTDPWDYQGTVTLSASSGSLNGPAGVAFDANGNLWVANASNTVVQLAASQLLVSGSPTPAVTLGATSGSLDGPSALAFDADGNLWVANANASTVVEFTGSQLAGSGSPTPAVKLSATNGSLSAPSSVAFDASGDLWVANAISGTVVEFGASQLGVSGAPTPVVTVSGSALSAPRGLAFDPPPPSSGAGAWDYRRSSLVAEEQAHPARAVIARSILHGARSPGR
jgi:sugar lactone lactonase YvrE